MEVMAKFLSIILITLSIIGCNQKSNFTYLHLQSHGEIFEKNQYVEFHLQIINDSFYYRFHDDQFGLIGEVVMPKDELFKKTGSKGDKHDYITIRDYKQNQIIYTINKNKYVCQKITEIKTPLDTLINPENVFNQFWERRKAYFIKNNLIEFI